MNLLRFLKILVYSTILLVGILAPTPALAKDEAGAAAILFMERMDLPQSTAAGVALVEARSGTVLLSVNGNEPLPPASTGKILTALLALDLVEDLDRSYTISPAAAAVEESSIDLQAGEELSLAELLRGALVHSGNDACYAIGEAVAGSERLFVHWLNMKAAVLGAYSAHLCNTNGLPAEGHVISSRRIWLWWLQQLCRIPFLRKRCVKNPRLWEKESGIVPSRIPTNCYGRMNISLG